MQKPVAIAAHKLCAIPLQERLRWFADSDGVAKYPEANRTTPALIRQRPTKPQDVSDERGVRLKANSDNRRQIERAEK